MAWTKAVATERVTRVLGPHEGQKWGHLQLQEEGAGAPAPSPGTNGELYVQAVLQPRVQWWPAERQVTEANARSCPEQL